MLIAMEKLAAYIAQNGYTQVEVARAIGCSEAALSLWLTGKRKIDNIAYAAASESWTQGAVTVEDLARPVRSGRCCQDKAKPRLVS